MRTANPALNENVFEESRLRARNPNAETMTISGTVNKSMFLLFLLLLPASWIWSKFFNGDTSVVNYILPAAIGALVIALVLAFKKTWAPVLAPAYAIVEGVVLGALSAFFESRYPGIVVQAVMLTFGTFAGLLFIYKSGYIKATENFKLGLFAATGGIFLIYMLTMVLGFFGVNIPYIHESGLIGIGFSIFVVIIAALNLVLDFDFIENGEEQGAPKYMEWYAAFGLIVTLVWLYIEFLRLLAKLNNRR